MSSSDERSKAPATSERRFPAEYDDGELDPELNTDSQVHPAFTTSKESKQLKEQSKAAKKENKNKDGAETLKSVVLVSGIVIAVIGAIYAIVKKLKEA